MPDACPGFSARSTSFCLRKIPGANIGISCRERYCFHQALGLHRIDCPGLSGSQTRARNWSPSRANADIPVIDDPLDNLIDTYTVCPCDP